MAFIDGDNGDNFMTEKLIELWGLLDDETIKVANMTEQEIKAYNAGYDDAVKDFSMWHPASKHPIVPKDEDSVWIYCLVYGKGTDGNVLVPMCVEFTKLGWRLSENIIVKWWCYPPKEE